MLSAFLAGVIYAAPLPPRQVESMVYVKTTANDEGWEVSIASVVLPVSGKVWLDGNPGKGILWSEARTNVGEWTHMYMAKALIQNGVVVELYLESKKEQP
jgi:hypothetical protein